MIAEKVSTMEYILYFCTVKSNKRHEVAAKMQRFLCPNLIVNSSRKEWVNSNVPKVSACLNLTAPIAAFMFNVKYKQV